MSLFVAVRPDLGAIDHLDEAIDRVRREPRARDLHWQPMARWHVTMAFLGDVDDERVEHAAEALSDVAPALPPVAVRLHGSGAFGRQIVWVGVSGRTDAEGEAFTRVARILQSALRGRGFAFERRPWRPHLTVARTRGADARPCVSLLESYSGPVWPIAELLLVQSQGGPAPTHTVVHRVNGASPEETR